MPTVQETSQSKPALAAALAAGLNVLAANQKLTFTPYMKWVSPLDGSVFWIINAGLAPLTVLGSLHHATELRQNEDETASYNTVIFTAEQPVNDLNANNPQVLYICQFGELTFSFSTRGNYFKQADLHHYMGTAVLPAMQSQIINNVTTFNFQQLIVSNSLPLWLATNNYTPPYPGFISPVTLYSSFAVPENIQPPYGVVHIEPESTKAIASAPFLDQTLGHYQLCQERVRVTIYGLNKWTVMKFLDFIYQYSYDYSYIGIMESPVIRDEKRVQPEIASLAMKQTIEFNISYEQQQSRNTARQLIETSITSVVPRTPLAPNFFAPPWQVPVA